MKQDDSGRWLDDSGEAASGLEVVRDPKPGSPPGHGVPRYVVDGWEVSADTYRLFLYDREVDTRETIAESGGGSSQLLAALLEAGKSAAPRPAPAAVPAPVRPAPTPVLVAPAPAPLPPPPTNADARKFDR